MPLCAKLFFQNICNNYIWRLSGLWAIHIFDLVLQVWAQTLAAGAFVARLPAGMLKLVGHVAGKSAPKGDSAMGVKILAELVAGAGALVGGVLLVRTATGVSSSAASAASGFVWPVAEGGQKKYDFPVVCLLPRLAVALRQLCACARADVGACSVPEHGHGLAAVFSAAETGLTCVVGMLARLIAVGEFAAAGGVAEFVGGNLADPLQAVFSKTVLEVARRRGTGVDAVRTKLSQSAALMAFLAEADSDEARMGGLFATARATQAGELCFAWEAFGECVGWAALAENVPDRVRVRSEVPRVISGGLSQLVVGGLTFCMSVVCVCVCQCVSVSVCLCVCGYVCVGV